MDLPRNIVVLVLAGCLLIGNTGAPGAEYHNTLTINSARVAGDLNDFVVYVDLADMMDGFWNNLTIGPGTTDIVVKNAGGTVLSREIVWLDEDSRKGEMHFKADSLSGTSDTSFAISVGGGSLTDNRGTDTWSNGYLGVWHLGEEDGDHNDSTSIGTEKDGHRNHNTYEADGKLGAAQCFDGSDDYIEIGSLGIGGNTLLTVSAWVNLAKLPSQCDGQHATVWGNYASDDNRSLLNVSADDDKLTAFARAGGSTVIDDVKGDPPMTANTWQYVAVCLNATAATAEVCLDGVFTSGGYLSAIQANNHVIGTMDNNHYFGGVIDEFRIANTARTSVWLTTAYNNQSSPGTFYEALPDPTTLAILCGGAAAAVLFGPKPKRSREKDLPT